MNRSCNFYVYCNLKNEFFRRRELREVCIKILIQSEINNVAIYRICNEFAT